MSKKKEVKNVLELIGVGIPTGDKHNPAYRNISVTFMHNGGIVKVWVNGLHWSETSTVEYDECGERTVERELAQTAVEAVQDICSTVNAWRDSVVNDWLHDMQLKQTSAASSPQ